MTKSPVDSVPFCTPMAAMTMTATRPAVMMKLWPAFRNASDCDVLIAAPS